MGKKTLDLGKYEHTLIRIEGKDILLCGTPMTFDDVIEEAVSNIFKMLDMKFLENNCKNEDYIDAVKTITTSIIEEFEKKNNLTVEYQDEEF